MVPKSFKRNGAKNIQLKKGIKTANNTKIALHKFFVSRKC